MQDRRPPLTALTEREREQAMRRHAVLQPHLEHGTTLAAAARAAGVAERTAQRWLAAYRRDGLAGLARRRRSDAGVRRLPDELVALIEGLSLQRPAPTMRHIARQAAEVASREGWPVPHYTTVRSIIRDLDPALASLARDGTKAYTQAFELLHRHEADRPNELWQADHTRLDLLLADGTRPWLTLIVDDHSRAITGYALSTDAPSALATSLALRQAIWHKPEPGWDVCGIPQVLYVDHGSDFISDHLAQVAVDLDIRLVHSAVGRPRGRGKIERLFRTVNQLLLADLPGHLAHGRTTSPPALTMTALDQQLRGFIVEGYNRRPHGQTGIRPAERWAAGGFLPTMPESLEQLDLLLATVAASRVVHRDGIRFATNRYLDPTLAGFIGQPVTIRYDPRDLAEIRVFHDGAFICRAICPDLADLTISLADVIAARRQRRRDLHGQLHSRRELVDHYLAAHQPQSPPEPVPSPATVGDPGDTPRPRLKRYRHG